MFQTEGWRKKIKKIKIIIKKKKKKKMFWKGVPKNPYPYRDIAY